MHEDVDVLSPSASPTPIPQRPQRTPGEAKEEKKAGRQAGGPFLVERGYDKLGSPRAAYDSTNVFTCAFVALSSSVLLALDHSPLPTHKYARPDID